MAVAYSLTTGGSGVKGDVRYRSGTFTSAAGDGPGETLTNSTHGLNFITRAEVFLNNYEGQNNLVTSVSSGTVTWNCENTLGSSGRWYVEGR